MAITLRTDKGSPLTFVELDNNFIDLDTRINQLETSEVISINGKDGIVTLTTVDIPENTNLYYTEPRFLASLANANTNILPEGTVNFYFTNARARSSISVGTGLGYNTLSGQITLTATTTNISEGTNLYFSNARVDSKLAVTSLDALFDVNYPSPPTNNQVLLYNGTSGKWEPGVVAGGPGGGTSTGANLGTGQGVYSNTFGDTLQFYTLAGNNGITVSAPVSNVISISPSQDLRITASPTFSGVNIANIGVASNSITSTNTNGDINLYPNGSGNVNIVSGSGNVSVPRLRITSLSSGSILFVDSSGNVIGNSNLISDGNTITLAGNANIQRIEAGEIISTDLIDGGQLRLSSNVISNNITNGNINITPNGTGSVILNGSNVFVSANLRANTGINSPSITSGNITLSGNTISSALTNGNIQITPPGSGEVIASTLTVSDLTSTRVVFAGANGSLTDNANLTFNGTTLTVLGIANISTINSTIVNGGNLRLSTNILSSTTANSDIIITPNGSGRVGIGKTPTTLLDVNGTITSNSIVVNGSTTLGALVTDVINLFGRIGSSIVPSISSSYDLGSSSNKFRSLWLAGNLTIDASTIIGDSISDSLTINAGINSNILPFTTNVYTLGSTTLQFTNVYSRVFTSSVATGTAPFVVASTTQVANLNAATAGTAATVTTAAQPNITSVGTLTALSVNAPINATRFVSNIATGTAPLSVNSTTQIANLHAQLAGTVTTADQPNITSLGTLTSLSVSGAASAASVSSSGSIVSTGSNGIGYAAGAGGTVTQATSITTAVTINRICGQITLVPASIAAYSSTAFTVNNNTVSAGNVVNVSIASGSTNRLTVSVCAVSNGSFNVILSNCTAAATGTTTIVINYAVIRSVNI